ncbi:DUF6911 family protein [Leeia aquatica]|uniref:Uncharacterized protein n=1 Tax=Leeia aquatica TaxID=2725557 RepID=A0A847SED1_9NEIS|nr:hypothetical protein [Leeia aquatica]NLR74312.1 hypothetical protein [Leeia aquatica]
MDSRIKQQHFMSWHGSPKSGSAYIKEWHEVNYRLQKLKFFGGSLSLSIYPEPDSGTLDVSVESSGGYYFISSTYNNGLTDSITEVRTYNGMIHNYPSVEMYGHLWPGSLLCRDYTIVEQVFKDFFERGVVPESILS